MALDAFLCSAGQWTPLRGDLSPVPFTPPPPDPDGPNTDDLGVVGARPALTTPPTAVDTGPREAPTQTMSGSEAITAVLAAPVEADGRRYLRRASVGSISFTEAQHTNIVFEDCVFEGGLYTVRGFLGSESVDPSDNWPELRYCEIYGGSSACFMGSKVRFLRCDMHRSTDIVKPTGDGGEFYGCYMHDNWHEPGDHNDTFQITSSAHNLLVHWCNLQGFVSLDSPDNAGQTVSGVLQTGTVTGDIGPVQWHDNWVDGGGYTWRWGTTSNRQGYSVLYEYRRNKHGRNYSFGPTMGVTLGVDFDASNVWADTGESV